VIRVFFSYRHGSERAGEVLTLLRGKLGPETVVCDDGFVAGPTLEAQVQSAIDRCGALVVLVDPDWIREIKRLHETEDWVRLEITRALQSRVPVIPIVTSGASMPAAHLMPAEVRPITLGLWHKVEVTHQHSAGCARVVHSLTAIERGHARAYGAYVEVMQLLGQGAWSDALALIDRVRIENARDDPAVRANRYVPVLLAIRRDLLALQLAEQAFEDGEFEHAHFVLTTPCHLSGMFSRGRHAAQIAVRAAAALPRGDGHTVHGARVRLATLQNTVAGAFVPGADRVKAFLDKVADILTRRAGLEDEARAMHEAACRMYEDPIVAPDLDEDPSLDGAGVDLAAFEERAEVAKDKRYFLPGRSDALQGAETEKSVRDATAADELPRDHAPETQVLKISPERLEISADSFIHADGNPAHREVSHEAARVFAEHAKMQYSELLKDINQKRFVELLQFVDDRSIVVDWRTAFGAAVPSLPARNLSEITFTVTAPTSMAEGGQIRVAIWAHRHEDQSYVIREARRDPGIEGTRDPSLLEVRIHTEDLQAESVNEGMRWQGRAVRALFALADIDGADRVVRITADVLLDGFRVARLDFPIRVGRTSGATAYIAADEVRHRRAFVSYAEADRPAVRQRLERLIALVPRMSVDDRCVRLRRRRVWSELMRTVIPRNNCMYLFWSDAASRSLDVGREWRCALEQGSDFISGIALDGTQTPPELREVPFWKAAALLPRVRGGRAS